MTEKRLKELINVVCKNLLAQERIFRNYSTFYYEKYKMAWNKNDLAKARLYNAKAFKHMERQFLIVQLMRDILLDVKLNLKQEEVKATPSLNRMYEYVVKEFKLDPYIFNGSKDKTK